MPPLKVVVTGASGKMAREVLHALCSDPEVEPAGAVSRKASEEYLSLPDGSGLIPLSSDLDSILTRVRPAVLVDFTNAEAVLATARTAFRHGVAPVIGTSGLDPSIVEELRRLSAESEVGAVVAPNFALGAVLLIQMARLAAQYFDRAEIVELHHEQKVDAPSGTALATAEAMVSARGEAFHYASPLKEPLPGARGASKEGIAIHSIRLPGLVAHQEVIFGGQGQTLTIRHDSFSRESFMPGVLLAIKRVVRLKSFVYGLDTLLELS